MAAVRIVDVVVTVPKALWTEWIAEGDLPGDPPTGQLYDYAVAGYPPQLTPGARVYVVAHGKLRGYAPLVRVEQVGHRRWVLVRGAGAVAVTIAENIRGFQGWRKRWWEYEAERPFPEWRTP